MKIDSEIIIKIHDKIASLYCLNGGVLNVGYLESIIEAMEYVSETNRYDTLLKKCSVLFEGIVRKHPFIDGNKRTALAAIQEYLFTNDIIFVTPLSAVRFSIKIASNTDQSHDGILQLQESIYKWIKYYTFNKKNKSPAVIDKMMKEMIKREIDFINNFHKLKNKEMGEDNFQYVIDYITGKDIYPKIQYTFNDIINFYKERLKSLKKFQES